MKKKIWIFLVTLIAILTVKSLIFADVGDFETYDYGDSDWSSSDYDSDNGNDNDYLDSLSGKSWNEMGTVDKVSCVLISYLLIVQCFCYGFISYELVLIIIHNKIEEKELKKINKIDKNFDLQSFKNYTENVFERFLYGLETGNFSSFNEAKSKDFSHRVEKRIRKYSKIGLNYFTDWIAIKKFKHKRNKDTISVWVTVILPEEKVKTYLLDFERDLGIKMQENVLKCQKCGAPLDITSSRKCEYCGSVYNKEQKEWKLKDITPFK